MVMWALAKAVLIKTCDTAAFNPSFRNHEKEITMFIALAVILAIAWILGFGVFHVASAAIHVLVVLAIVSVVLHFVRGQKRMT
jgi:Family of unknown function (DUF5670)